MINLCSTRLDLTHKRHTPLSVAEERALCTLVVKGDRGARDRLINANMKFVVAVAKMYTGKGVPFEDLVGEGARGLVTAADRYNPATSNRFISYAVWWIRQSIIMALNEQGGGIRTPSINQLNSELKAAKALGKEERIEAALARTELFQKIRNTRSLEELHAAGFDPADEFADPTAGIERRDIRRRAEKALSVLKPVEQAVLRRYYGFHQGFQANLGDVGEHFGVTRERVRQRKENGMRKMRHKFAFQNL